MAFAAIFFGLLAFVFAVSSVFFFRTSARAYIAGRRDGMLAAARLIEERGDLALELAPQGRIIEGLVRCSTMLDLAEAVRESAKLEDKTC